MGKTITRWGQTQAPRGLMNQNRDANLACCARRCRHGHEKGRRPFSHAPPVKWSSVTCRFFFPLARGGRSCVPGLIELCRQAGREGVLGRGGRRSFAAAADRRLGGGGGGWRGDEYAAFRMSARAILESLFVFWSSIVSQV